MRMRGGRQVDILLSKLTGAIKGISFVFDCLAEAGTNSDCSVVGGNLNHRSGKEKFSGRGVLEWLLEFKNWARSFRIRCMGLLGRRENRSKRRGKDDGGGESVVQTGIERELVHMVGWSQGDGVTSGGWASPRSLAGPRDDTEGRCGGG